MTNNETPAVELRSVLSVVDEEIRRVRNVLVGADYSGRYDIAGEAEMRLLTELRTKIVAAALAETNREPEYMRRNESTTTEYVTD